MREGFIILGNQLFETTHFEDFKAMPIFMAEDDGLCTHFRYHKHKLIFFLAAMRVFKDQLTKEGFTISYRQLKGGAQAESYRDVLTSWIKKQEIEKIHFYEIEDHFFAQEIKALLAQLQVSYTEHPSPLFLVSRSEFQEYLASVKRPFMKTFYERMRTHFKVLMDGPRPVGGQFSFDSENRKKIPAKIVIPGLPKRGHTHQHTIEQVSSLVDERFKDHPGQSDNFWAAVSRSEALLHLDDFVETRLPLFGDYQDALDDRDPFLFHSVLSPYINAGLLTPAEVLERVLLALSAGITPLNSVEGFIRQVLGWREFVRGIYQNFDSLQQQKNFFDHQHSLGSCWYGKKPTGLPPLDQAIQKTLTYSYAHHIERLMVLSNVMLLCRVHPQEAYRWFMEMYLDSSDWVMGPNVFGMGQFSDGGLFATKPYICGSNYWIKMGATKTGDWAPTMDGLYWLFIHDNKDFFARNPRLSLSVKSLAKMDTQKKKIIFKKAQDFIELVTN